MCMYVCVCGGGGGGGEGNVACGLHPPPHQNSPLYAALWFIVASFAGLHSLQYLITSGMKLKVGRCRIYRHAK